MKDYKTHPTDKHNVKPTISELAQSILFFAIVLSVMFLPDARELLTTIASAI